MSRVGPGVAKALLATTALSVSVAIVCGLGWFLAARPSAVRLEQLGLEDRQRLVESFFAVTSRSRTPAWFEPGLSFTLGPETEITAWGDTFTSNELGFRTAPAPKPTGAFRVLFVGDSWTYGMGGTEADSFPKQLETLAREHGASGRPVEAWTLALPGWNTFNELTALQVYFDRLEPDAVVLCPTRNDNASELYVLPDGSLRRPVGVVRDLFGSDHSLDYRYRIIDSHRYLERWRQAFDAVAETGRWLAERDVPFLLFFVASWDEELVHHLMVQSNVGAPYAITDPELATPQRQLPRWGHAPPEVNRLYGIELYRALGSLLGWAPLPDHLEAPGGARFDRPPPGDWDDRARRVARAFAARIPGRYVAGPEVDPRLCPGPMDCASGLMGRATTVLLRRLPDSTRLEVAVRSIAGSTALRPVDLRVTIPGGDETSDAVLSVTGRRAVERVRIDLPDSIEAGSVMDVELRASAATLAPDVLALRSLYVESLTQLP